MKSPLNKVSQKPPRLFYVWVPVANRYSICEIYSTKYFHVNFFYLFNKNCEELISSVAASASFLTFPVGHRKTQEVAQRHTEMKWSCWAYVWDPAGFEIHASSPTQLVPPGLYTWRGFLGYSLASNPPHLNTHVHDINPELKVGNLGSGRSRWRQRVQPCAQRSF